MHMTEEQKAIRSKANIGKVPWNKGKLSGPPSTATRVKISETLTGHTVSLEVRTKISTALVGHVMSPEWRAKLSTAHMNPSPETRAKLSTALWKGGVKASCAKRRALGFHSLNSWFPGCEGHHINKSDVIYLPRKLHRSISHNQWTGRNMDKINALAGEYLTEDWT